MIGIDWVASGRLEIVVPYEFKTVGLLDIGGFLTLVVMFDGVENCCCFDFCVGFSLIFEVVAVRPCNSSNCFTLIDAFCGGLIALVTVLVFAFDDFGIASDVAGGTLDKNC